MVPTVRFLHQKTGFPAAFSNQQVEFHDKASTRHALARINFILIMWWTLAIPISDSFYIFFRHFLLFHGVFFHFTATMVWIVGMADSDEKKTRGGAVKKSAAKGEEIILCTC